MDDLKLAFDHGAEVAREQHRKEMQDKLKRRLAEIGWKEQPKPPAKLSDTAK